MDEADLVAVHVAELVGDVEPLGRARADVGEPVVAEARAAHAARVPDAPQRLAHHELERAVEAAPLLTELEESHDARVTERGDELHFVEEHRDEIFAVSEFVFDDFERNPRVVVLGDRRAEAAAEVDRGHAAFADLRDHLVATELRGNFVGRHGVKLQHVGEARFGVT